jgi:hypothetical protein
MVMSNVKSELPACNCAWHPRAKPKTAISTGEGGVGG